MQTPAFPFKLLIPILFAIALLIPLTRQFFIPATPIFAYLLSFYSSRFIPESYRPPISVSLLPTLESVLYGANISDILTRFTHPLLDILAWIPYGVGHFALPFVVAFFIWTFRTKQVLWLWGRVFGYFNLTGVIIQIILPCAAPWYEVIHGLTPANYSMKGSPGGLVRIDNMFHSHTYTVGFSNAPVVFGAFPSLHAGCATMEALFLSHFFPQTTKWIWAYTALLYWSTMYLTHHYLIDVVAGACLAVIFFYLFLPLEFKNVAAATAPPPNLVGYGYGRGKLYDVDPERAPLSRRTETDTDFDDASSIHASDEEMDITYRSPVPAATVFPSHAQSHSFSQSNTPLTNPVAAAKKSHRHTASIASLTGSGSPVSNSFVFPPARVDLESGLRRD